MAAQVVNPLGWLRRNVLRKSGQILKVNHWLHSWCQQQRFNFYDQGIWSEDREWPGRDGVHLIKWGKTVISTHWPAWWRSFKPGMTGKEDDDPQSSEKGGRLGWQEQNSGWCGQESCYNQQNGVEGDLPSCVYAHKYLSAYRTEWGGMLHRSSGKSAQLGTLWATNVPSWQRRQIASWAALGEALLAAGDTWSFLTAQFCSDKSGVLCPVLSFPVQDRHEHAERVLWRATKIINGLEHLS